MASQNKVSPLGAAKKIFTLLRLDRKDVYAIYVFAILAGLVHLAMPLGIQTIISFVMAGSMSTSIIILIFLVVLAVFLNGLLQVRQMQVTEKIQQKIYVRYAMEFSDRLPKINIEKLDSYYLPELVNRFFDTISLQKGIEKILLDIPAAVIQIIFGVALLSLYHPVFIGFGAVLLIILYIILRYTLPDGFEASLEASNQKYATAAWLEEMARVIKTFKYSKGTSLNIQKTDGIVDKYLQARTNYFSVLLTQYWSLVSFKLIITAAMLIVGAVLLVDQQINIGQFIAADIVILSVIGSVEKLIGNLDKVYDVLTSVEKLSKITESDLETEGSVALQQINSGVSISFEQVNFGYSNTKGILQGINLQIKPGEKICIMGKSGAGKSSMLRLLTGAFKQFEGAILINNIPIDNYSLNSIRSQTGILLSQQDIFNGTIWENITMGNTEIKNTEVAALAEKCGLSSFIKNLPKGYDTILDPSGIKLTGNVRQNILLLRALLGNPRLLLLEEPLNYLEPEYKEKITDYLMKKEEVTILMATNDKSLAAHANRVVYLEKGHIKAIGSWEQIKELI